MRSTIILNFILMLVMPGQIPLCNAQARKEMGIGINDIALDLNGESIMGLNSFVNLITNLRSKQRATLFALDHRTGRKGYVQFVMP